MPPADPDDEDWYDDEGESADLDDDAISCPECGAEIYADLDHCPKCGYWLSDDDRRTRTPGLFQSRGVKIVALALLVLFVLALIAGTLGW